MQCCLKPEQGVLPHRKQQRPIAFIEVLFDFDLKNETATTSCYCDFAKMSWVVEKLEGDHLAGPKRKLHGREIALKKATFWKGIGTRVGFLEGARKRVASKAGSRQAKENPWGSIKA